MLRYLNHHQIDKRKWDECIAGSCNTRVYSLSWYLDITCKNWDALVLDDYMAVFPLTARKKYGFHYLFQPHFCQQLGIFSAVSAGKAVISDFLEAIPPKFRFAEICINTENSSEILKNYQPVIKKKQKDFSGFLLKENSNFELDLTKPYDHIYKGYSENTRRNIRKAIKNKIQVSGLNGNGGEIIQLFKKNKGKEIPGLKRDFFSCLESIVKTGQEKKMIKISGAFDAEKNLCAAVVFLIFKGRAVFLFSASNRETRNCGAMFLLTDRFISENAGSLATLDFEGSNNPDLARFYGSFGAKEYVYLQLKKNSLPKFIQWLKQ